MQRSSRDPSVDFYEHSTQRGSTPGVDYFAQASHRRAQRFATGAMTPDSSSVSGEGGIPSRSASQFEGFQSLDRQQGQQQNQNKENADQQQQKQKQMNYYQQQQPSEELADEVPARHLSIIEVARQMLLPVFYERLLDRQGLIQCCGTVLDQFLETEKMNKFSTDNTSSPAAATSSSNANEPLSDAEIQQVQKLVQGQLREIQQKRPVAMMNQQNQYGGGGASDGIQSEYGGAGAGSSSYQRSAAGGGRLNRHNQQNVLIDNDDYDQDQYDELEQDGKSSSHHNRRHHTNQMARVSGQEGEQTTISGSSAGLINSNPNIPPSIFRSVSYMSKGPLPAAPPKPLPNGKQAASDAFLSLSLDKPHLTNANSDIVITGVVHTRALVDLRWWIAYGPMKLVIDLEKLRSVGAVGTFQVSHSAFILSIGAGTLIPGAEYTVHISAMAVDFAGIGKDARIEFVVPVAEDEADDVLWNRLQRMTSSGYSGDTEKGILSLRPDPQKMKELEHELSQFKKDAAEQAEQREKAAQSKKAEIERRAGIMAAVKAGKLDNASASRLLMSGQSVPAHIQAAMEAENNQPGSDDRETGNVAGTQLPDAAVTLAQQQSNSSSSYSPQNSHGGRGLTYHEQLRNFILNEVEPVYTLCASPRFTHEIFLDILRKVTKQFWHVRSGGSTSSANMLDRDLKKQILAELRKEISEYVQRSQGKALVSTAVSTGGSPKAAEMLQSSLENVSATAELNQVSLLSPDQRMRLAELNMSSTTPKRNQSRRGSLATAGTLQPQQQQPTMMHSTGVGSSPP